MNPHEHKLLRTVACMLGDLQAGGFVMKKTICTIMRLNCSEIEKKGESGKPAVFYFFLHEILSYPYQVSLNSYSGTLMRIKYEVLNVQYKRYLKSFSLQSLK
jgi:hypothetical protein